MKQLILVLVLVVSSLAHAQSDSKMGVMASLLYNTAEIDSAGDPDVNAELGYGLGMRALLRLNDRLFLRTGAGIIKKAFSIDLEVSPGITETTDVSFLYLNIPATLYLKASPQVGIFAGTAIQPKLDDDCEVDGGTCKVESAKSMVLPAILGFDFSFNEQFGIEFSYEYGIMESSKDTKVSSLVTSLVYNFE